MMASARGHDHPARLIEASCCQCSDGKMNKQQCSPYLESAVSKFEGRQGDLMNRQQYLRQKITTMERSIPALIALNMLKTGETCDKSPLCKVKQIMNQLSPHPDPTDKLLDKLQNTVKSLNGETAELHDKIIAADVKLEESEMELESLELANEEFEGRLKSLEKELKIDTTPSLHSIHSDDLVCLSKICQLGEAEVNLKNSIKELEERESLFHRQMDRIVKSKEFRNASCGGITKKIHKLECNERRMHCALHSQKCSVQQLKKELLRNEKERARINDVENSSTSAKEISDKEMTNPAKASNPPSDVTSGRDNAEQDELDHEKKVSSHQMPQGGNDDTEDSLTTCVCRTPTLKACYDASSCPTTSRSHAPNKSQSACNPVPFCGTCRANYSKCLQPSGCSLKSCCVSLASKSNVSRGQACPPDCKEALLSLPCKNANNLSAIKSKSCKGNISYKAPSNSQRMPLIPSPFPSDAGTLCTKCQGLKLAMQYRGQRKPTACRCFCKGKCATGESGIPCNCPEYLSILDKEGNQQSGGSTKINDQSSTDEEYCECCDCGCEDSDLSDTV